ncbi:hypothetical protein FA95DRAFT_1120467 [Auriscalpium vulgare]|uniref:Uncharacterized protein n=1 Tax=Auriscalpium vulgare TaxID=40419 RepID=A0ACB8RVV0_9AGAM|nr:hypothetical protein FA95DRAFT_1120467 [Auriscalpium vulgare]
MRSLRRTTMQCSEGRSSVRLQSFPCRLTTWPLAVPRPAPAPPALSTSVLQARTLTLRFISSPLHRRVPPTAASSDGTSQLGRLVAPKRAGTMTPRVLDLHRWEGCGTAPSSASALVVRPALHPASARQLNARAPRRLPRCPRLVAAPRSVTVPPRCPLGVSAHKPRLFPPRRGPPSPPMTPNSRRLFFFSSDAVQYQPTAASSYTYRNAAASILAHCQPMARGLCAPPPTRLMLSDPCSQASEQPSGVVRGPHALPPPSRHRRALRTDHIAPGHQWPRATGRDATHTLRRADVNARGQAREPRGPMPRGACGSRTRAA